MQAEWEDQCQNLEISNFETWKGACGLWRQSGWISKRLKVTANDRAEAERAWTLAQPLQPNPAPTMAMSLEQPLTVEALAEEQIPEAAALPVTPEQSGEHAAELTPTALLVDPIGGLSIYAHTETLAASPTRRASVSATSPTAEILPRSRHKCSEAIVRSDR